MSSATDWKKYKDLAKKSGADVSQLDDKWLSSSDDIAKLIDRLVKLRREETILQKDIAALKTDFDKRTAACFGLIKKMEAKGNRDREEASRGLAAVLQNEIKAMAAAEKSAR